MATIAAEKAMSYTNQSREGLWKRFKEYFAGNQQMIAAGLGATNGNSYCLQRSIRLGK